MKLKLIDISQNCVFFFYGENQFQWTEEKNLQTAKFPKYFQT